MNSLIVVDQYRRHKDSLENNYKVNTKLESQIFGGLMTLFGDDVELIAIVNQTDVEGLRDYNDAKFQTITMNGDRPDELQKFITEQLQQAQLVSPERVVIVSDDPQFGFLCSSFKKGTKVAICSPTSNIPAALNAYNVKRLDDLMPAIRIEIDKIDVHIDYENIHISLLEKGWTPNPKELVDAIRKILEDKGRIINIIVYADWDKLSRDSNRNFQREMAMIAGVDVRYQVSERGKNSADMEIASNIHTTLEVPDSINVIVLVSMDRDFRPVIESVKRKGKQAIILALRSGLSRELEQAAHEVLYLDDYLDLSAGEKFPLPTNESKRVALHLVAWMNQKKWNRVYHNRLPGFLNAYAYTSKDIDRLVKDEVLTKWHNDDNALAFNRKHRLAQTVLRLAGWLPSRVKHCLHERRMAYVDTNYLAKGMERDRRFQELKVGQNRSEAEAWLKLAAEVGIVETRQQPHPKSPSRIITTWWLLGEAPKVEIADAKDENVEARLDKANEIEVGAAVETLKPKRPLLATPTLIATDEDAKLFGLLDESFSEEELKNLCFRLGSGFKFDDLGGQGRLGKARELVQKLRRQKQTGRLCKLLATEYAHLPLPAFEQTRPHYHAAQQLGGNGQAGAAVG